ncbi:MAG: flippase-like domain-containing protein, partial [Ruminococcus sp.]|nr:flippase-like domain-containing protein [Ruminococcus sp.]
MKNRVASIRKQVLNIATLAVLIGFTFFVIFNNKDGFSLNSLVDFVSDIHFPFLIGAFLCMFMNIGFKGLSIAALSRALGYRRSLPRNYAYASADIYFSAITPSATGGQPASAFYMVKDDIPISHTTAILSVNLFMYTASLIVLALITFILRPSLFFNLESWVVKVCIIIGLLVQLLLLSLYLMIMISEKMVVKLATWLVNFLALLHIVKH